MKKILSLVVSLSLIAAVCAGVLALVNEVSQKPMEEAKKNAAEKAVRAVLPQLVAKIENRDGLSVGYAADGSVAGYALEGSDGSGYGGTVKLMVGFMPDFKVVAYKKLEANETPGLGAKLVEPEFSGQFAGKDVSGAGLAVTKDGGSIVPITAATITSRAVCRAVNAARDALRARLAR